MPLVRVEVRNEYGLGMPELYTETNREDPKAVLEGVAVAGLVGLLRQLGDLAEFAAEIFHGLQEQVLITSSRSHKLIERVHHIEVALPPLEKAILAQRSHLHFAYTAGSHWHTRIRTEQNHFIYSDLPRCIMDSYEDCHDPPRLSKLDKFDIGGPGSCFRRYSDPTYFKRSSTGPYGAHLQSVPRQKKARRNKKKRSSSKYKDVTRGAHVITHSGRYNANVEDKSSLSQDALTFHVPRKSGIEREFDHLTSFDSKTGSSYIECIFRPSCSTQSEDYSAKEPEPEPEPSSDSNVQQNLDSASLDETINNSYSAEDSRSKSSYITWDEKLEIIDSAGQPDESTEIPCKKIDTGENEDLNYRTVDHVDFDSQDEQPCKKIDTGENEDLNYRTVDHVDFDSQDEQPCTMPVVLRGQHDEIESETDYYMDALNTIESESENDQDCHTKRELKQYVNVNDQKSDLMNNESQLEVHVPERKSDLMNNESQLEVHVPEKTYLSPTSIPLESHMESNGSSNSENHEDVITHMAEISPTSLTTSNRFKAEEVERIVTKAETVASPREVETIVTKPNEPISSYESPKPLISTSGGQSQTTVNNPVPLRSTSGGQTQTTVNNPVMFWTNGGLLGLEPSKPPDYGSPIVVGPNPVKETKTETKTDSTQHSGKENNINDIKSESSGKVLDEVDEHDPIGSSRIFEFSNRLLVNGFRKQISLVGNERLANSVKTEVPENGIVPKRYETVTGIPFKEQFGNRSSLISPSSPPLEHMKISFQPIDGFETSKLKLAFPDGNGNANESNGHMFPSFQLIPEPAIEVHEFVSDSDDDDDDDDDDTFCRSSPYASDDCRSNPSESNSEQWDSSESPRIKDHELDDAFGRISVISSAESASSSVINGGMIFDIPSFDSIKASQNQVANDLKGPTPPPPPLPPMEWRGVKSTPDATMDKEDDVELSEALTYSLNLTPKQPAPPPQPKLPPRKQDNNVVETDSHVVKHNQPDWQNLHTQNRSTHMFNGKAGDEKEDLLQQIRTKSRDLRRISTAQPTATSTGPASNKVAAILEKASAIRQAVGSDDGEDNWSDT